MIFSSLVTAFEKSATSKTKEACGNEMEDGMDSMALQMD